MKSINIGVAAHITAASEGGQRYDSSLTPKERQSAKNGIWLCQACAKLVDNDPIRYSVDILKLWKELAEKTAVRELESRHFPDTDSAQVFMRLENIMPVLINEMRDDLSKSPLSREFVILSKKWTYNARGHELVYYSEDHPELENKIRILLNYNLIQDITSSNVSRYIISEELAGYLGSYN